MTVRITPASNGQIGWTLNGGAHGRVFASRNQARVAAALHAARTRASAPAVVPAYFDGSEPVMYTSELIADALILRIGASRLRVSVNRREGQDAYDAEKLVAAINIELSATVYEGMISQLAELKRVAMWAMIHNREVVVTS